MGKHASRMGLAAVLLWVGFWFIHALHYWEDDAYIHLEYARSVFQGRGFMFNGRLSNGDTSPLWVLLLAATHVLSADWLVSGKLLAVTGALFSVAMAWAFAQRLAKETGVTSPTTVAVMVGLHVLSPFFCFWAFSGMEAVAAAGLVMLQTMLLVPQRPRPATFFGAALALGIGPLVRPELGLMIATGGFFLLHQWRQVTTECSPSRKATWFGLAAVLLALPLALWAVYALSVFGHVTPNTNAAKRAMPGEPVLTRLISVSGLGFPGVLIGLGLWLALLLPSPLRAKAQGAALSVPVVAWPLLLWCAATVVFYLVNHTYVQTRYVMVFAPGLMFVLLMALRARCRPWVFAGAVGLTAALELGISLLMSHPNVRNKALVQEATVAFVKDVQRIVPRTEPIAIYSIGQVAFLLDNPLVDIGGITQPEAIPYLYKDTAEMARWAQSKGARYYVWGQAPLPGATPVAEMAVQDSGWFPKRSQYEVSKPSYLWRLPAAGAAP